MEVNISEIVTAKLNQMDRDGIIQKKIEETLEKTVLDAVTSELGGYSFKRSISEQVSKSISDVAANCGFSAYNGFIAERVKAIIQDMYTADISERVQAALNDVMLNRHENVKLSDLFSAYRKWVLAHTEESDKYERREFTCRLGVKESGLFTHYICTFADRPLEDTYGCSEYGDIEIRFCVYENKNKANISTVCLAGHDVSKSLRIGRLTDFEAFVVNLFYNKTEISLDLEDVDEDCGFDVDC